MFAHEAIALFDAMAPCLLGKGAELNAQTKGTWLRVCGTEDIDREEALRFDHESKTYAVFRSPDGEFFATDGVCTHEHAFLTDGLVVGHQVECPKHRGVFNYQTGEAEMPPACVDLQIYPVKVQDGAVWIDIVTPPA